MAQPREVIEILSDSDDDVLEIPGPHRPAGSSLLQPDPLAAQDSTFDAEWDAIMAALEEHDGADAGAQPVLGQFSVVIEPDAPRPMTEDQCLAKVLEIYPDISHDHVRTMFRDGLEVGMQADSTWCDQLIVRILDEGRYPTEREAQRAALKRKREPEGDELEQDPFENGPYAARRAYQSAATNVLQNEYPEVPVKFIEQTLRREHSFFKAFIHIEAAERTYSDTDRSRRPYKKVRRRDPKALGPSPSGLEGAMMQAIQKVQRELTAAKKKVRDEAAKREKDDLRRLKEERNESEARSANAMTDCQCCFTEYPTNRMTYCNGEEVHFFCHECAQNYVNSQLGMGKCRPKCMATTDCEADFSRAQLVAFLDPKEFDRLEKMQQKEDLRNAGIEGLEECPFCDYQAICEPVEVDREFRCPSCYEVSCRLCHLESHTPRTCEEASKDRKCRARVEVENAMSEALIRVCNKCKNKFIKESGCNKMTCGSCGNTQCYVCSANVTGYDHFHQSAGKCPLYDNSDKRHQEEVKKAEAKAIAKIKEQNPDISEEELKVKVSDCVQQAEQKRIERAEQANRPPGFAPFLGPVPVQPLQPVARGRMAAGVPGIHFFEPGGIVAHAPIGRPAMQAQQANRHQQQNAAMMAHPHANANPHPHHGFHQQARRNQIPHNNLPAPPAVQEAPAWRWPEPFVGAARVPLWGNQHLMGLGIDQLGRDPLELARAHELPEFQRLVDETNRAPLDQQAREELLFRRVHGDGYRRQNELEDEFDRLRDVERQNRPGNENMNEAEQEYRRLHGLWPLGHGPGRGR